MDVRRAITPPARRHLWFGIVAGLVLAAIVATVTLTRTAGSGAAVDRSTMVVDTAQRGALTISIAAAGVLAAESVHVVDAVEPGVVESLEVRPGSVVAPGDIIARMQDPETRASLVQASSALQV
ncbi:MAG: biotin/lipoyl-binding protein, partial [Candidatus Cybelea sp.]